MAEGLRKATGNEKRIRFVMEMTGKRCAGCKKKTCTGCNMAGQLYNGKEKNSVFPKDYRPDEDIGLGIAIDLGTTTVAGLLWDLERKVQLAAEVCINPGRFAGSDVISRIAYVRECDDHRQKMRQIMVKQLDEMAHKLALRIDGYGCLEVKRVVIVGNTVMCQFLLGLSVEGLAKAPFHKEYKGSVRKKGSELGFSFLKEANIIILPAIEGYVGADALAVYTYIKHRDENKGILAVDIGTNGEIILFGKERNYACSAAAGPALEGAAVYQGMGAVEGAIEEVRLAGNFPQEDIFCKVIGKGMPKGICGSGLVDALAILKRLGVIDETGYLKSADEARKAGVRERICQRIITDDGEPRFLLTDRSFPVYLTADDIRQLQLAKGAIRAGIEILLEKEKMTKEEIKQIYLAGAFGSYIKIESAVEIGLLPDIPGERIVHVGNCAGTGAVMALLSERTAREMEEAAEAICHVELAKESRFQEHFMNALGIRKL